MEDTQEMFSKGEQHFFRHEWDDAVKEFAKCMSVDVAQPNILRLYAKAEYQRSNYEEALVLINMAIAYEPYDGSAYTTLAGTLSVLGKVDESLAAAYRSCELSPNAPMARWNLGLGQLRAGNLNLGFINWRWGKVLGQRLHRTLQPEWEGNVNELGHTLYVWDEQGIGDKIHFVRYVKELRERIPRDTKIVLELHPEVIPLMVGLEGPDLIVASMMDRDIPVEFTDHIGLMDLPLVLGPTIKPIEEPYIKVNKSLDLAAKELITTLSGKKKAIGIKVKGNKRHPVDNLRSFNEIPKEWLAAPNTTFFSLDQDQDFAPPPEVVDCKSMLNNWASTAALINNLDLVVSVDTAVAHLAGALMKPVWNMIYVGNDWRWFNDRLDSPWYPTMRLFRQSAPKDWTSVIGEVSNELRNL